MKIKIVTLFTAGLVALGCDARLRAAAKEEASASPAPTTAASTRPIPFNVTIFAVDKAAKTFSTQNKEKKIRVFAITPETKITKSAKPAGFEELKAGENVRGSALKKGEGHFDVLSAEIGAKDESAKAAPAASAVPSGSPGGKKKAN